MFSSRCAKWAEAASPERPTRKTGKLGRDPTNEATEMAVGTNSVVLGLRHRDEGAANGGTEEKSNTEEEEAM